MIRIGLIKEGKIPRDTRVALAPHQCAAIMQEMPGIRIIAQPSPYRCFPDEQYLAAGVPVQEDVSDCDILLGIKEVPVDMLIPGKTYLFFSHTRKAQPYNRGLMKALIRQRIRMIDYECLTHADEQRILGFGFFAGLVGAHNGLWTYGQRTGSFNLPRAFELGSAQKVEEAYSTLILPNIKIVLTGSGKVAAGVLEVMHELDVEYIEPEDFLEQDFAYPVYTHLKGHTLYIRKDGRAYHRDDFHANPSEYHCVFEPYLTRADILMNGVYWDRKLPKLFAKHDISRPDFRMNVMADITCDVDGSVPINIGATSIADPVYGVNRFTLERVAPFQDNPDIIDVMAVDNLPNELACDASAHFGIHLEKYVLRELMKEDSEIINRATICRDGRLTPGFEYLNEYAYG